MSTVAARKPSHSRNHSAHAPAFKKRAQNTSNVEKWDVVMWNDEVHSSSTVPSPHDHRQSPLSSRSASSDNIPRSFISVGTNSAPSGPSLPGNTTPSFAFTASAFGFGTPSTKPKPIPRRTPPCSPTAESPQIRLDALASLHRSVQEHDASFLARMRELEERCHLLPDSLAVLRSEDLSHTTRGRKRGCASWDEDGDVEMSCWNERRQRHFDARSCSRLSFGHSEPSAEESNDLKESSSSEDEYVLPDQEGEDSHSEDEEDDDLDIVIVEGDSVPSLFNSGSTPSSLSTSLSSLPARSDGRSPNLRNCKPLPGVLGTKDIDELSMAMAGGAGSVVDWCAPAHAGDANDIGSATAEAGALWA
ncbi:hypothetical protein RhiLY_03922 [Ceratobasidium sp. AG-Ba]|nr:hypothetical protein RhiLY_03922 [Ceratobasidium sp. AG-Ba]